MKVLDLIAERLWRFFSSMRLALGLFISLAVSTMAGSIVLQRPIAEPGQLERVYGPETIVWLDRFGLLDVFHSWWYVLQLALLALSLTVVSIDMWPRFRSRILSFSPVLPDGDLPEMHARVPSPAGTLEERRSLAAGLAGLIKRRFRRPRVTEKDGKIYLGAESAKWAHCGVYVIHTGIVLVLLGGMITGLKGFEGMIQLSPGEKAGFYFDRKVEGKRVPLGFDVRCTGARMEKYPDGNPKAYFSDLEIVDDGQVVAKKTIKVNDPLSYKGIYFYQATFGQKAANERTSVTLDVRDKKTGKAASYVTDFDKVEKLPNGKGTLKVIDYAENIPLDVAGHQKSLGEAVKLELSENGGAPKTVWLFKNFPDFDRDMRDGAYHLTFQNFSYDYDTANVTGLQVARNPGIDVTWIGSGLLMFGLLATFWIPHRKLWIVVSENEILVAAASHRHPDTFGGKMKRIVRLIETDILKNHHVEANLVFAPRAGANTRFAPTVGES